MSAWIVERSSATDLKLEAREKEKEKLERQKEREKEKEKQEKQAPRESQWEPPRRLTGSSRYFVACWHSFELHPLCDLNQGETQEGERKGM